MIAEAIVRTALALSRAQRAPLRLRLASNIDSISQAASSIAKTMPVAIVRVAAKPKDCRRRCPFRTIHRNWTLERVHLCPEVRDGQRP